ncbi:hypothetical protein OHA71_25620 [Streptomyces sp. NBC_00444]|uniref:hypothetical protein n=1 Tax=Streptomyces sp. NBC_00444 TaxID=2975744 RepID=UPI002E1C7C9F
MTPVQVDWLTLLLAPFALVGLVVAFPAIRSAIKRGEPAPGWAKGIQGVAVTCALLIALLNVARTY